MSKITLLTWPPKRQGWQRLGKDKSTSEREMTNQGLEGTPSPSVLESRAQHLATSFSEREGLSQSQLKKDKRKEVWPISRELKRGSQVSRESKKHCKVSHGTVAQGPCALATKEWYRPPGHLDDSLLKCRLCVAPFVQLPWWQDHCLLLPPALHTEGFHQRHYGTLTEMRWL